MDGQIAEASRGSRRGDGRQWTRQILTNMFSARDMRLNRISKLSLFADCNQEWDRRDARLFQILIWASLVNDFVFV